MTNIELQQKIKSFFIQIGIFVFLFDAICFGVLFLAQLLQPGIKSFIGIFLYMGISHCFLFHSIYFEVKRYLNATNRK